MDAAVALVQAYLRLNGYFTETEYPIIARRRIGAITLTDLDVLAIRFPGAKWWVPEGHGGAGLGCDPKLDISHDGMDMIIGEVKEGKGSLHPALHTPEVLEAVIRRFGCCFDDPRGAAVKLASGRHADARLHNGSNCRVRFIVFCGLGGPRPGDYSTISLVDVVRFISAHLHENADLFLHTAFKDDTLGLLALVTKLGFRLH